MAVPTAGQPDRLALYLSRYDVDFSAVRERSIPGGSKYRFVDLKDYGNMETGFRQFRDSRMFVIMGEVDCYSEPVCMSYFLHWPCLMTLRWYLMPSMELAP
jgi:hypothetical protein